MLWQCGRSGYYDLAIDDGDAGGDTEDAGQIDGNITIDDSDELDGFEFDGDPDSESIDGGEDGFELDGDAEAEEISEEGIVEEEVSAFPQVTAVIINNDAQYTLLPLVTVRVAVSDPNGDVGLMVRLAETTADGDCQAMYANDNWQGYQGAYQDYSFLLSTGDGVKKVCAWAKDSNENISVIFPATGTLGVDCDTIIKEIDNIPQIVTFEVVNGNSASPDYQTRTFAMGDTVEVSWSITDVEGLDNNPITLEYSTDDDNDQPWNQILSDFGSLTQNPTSYSNVYTGFSAPVGNFFRLRLLARDMSGNTSVRALSDILNTNAWNVYAGNSDRGVGTMGRSAKLESSNLFGRRFAIDPLTNDIYAADDWVGFIKLSAETGEVSLFAIRDSNNLPDDGPLPANPTVYSYYAYLEFDQAGRLYLVTYQQGGTVVAESGAVYQIDLTGNTVKRYIGGGTSYDPTAAPFEMLVVPNHLAFDEDDSLYFLSSCTPGAASDQNPVFRLMKVTQNPDGTAGTFSVVAGDCTSGQPVSGALATESPFPTDVSSKGRLPELTVWNQGQAIYVTGTNVWKILDGRFYLADSALDDPYSMTYDPISGRLLVAQTSLRAYTPDLTGDGGEVLERIVAGSDGTGNCTADGVDSQNACVKSRGVIVTGQGLAIFSDGPSNDRLRYVDPTGRIQTLLGTLPLYGNGLHRRFLRGSLGGIYYKQPTEPNQAAFPAGLYFASPDAVVFGYIDPNTNLTSILWGNQQGGPYGVVHPTGTVIGPDVSLGSANDQGNLMALGFGDGLPFLRYNNVLAKVDELQQVVALQQGGTPHWEDFNGPDLLDSDLSVYGTRHNLSIKDGGIFLLGSYRAPTADPESSPVIRFFDFVSNTIVDIMGDKSVSGFSPDTAVPGSVQGLTLDDLCVGCEASGYHVYRSDQDRLYFSENDKIRYISNPTDPAQSTLTTLFTGAGSPIQDFTISPSGDKVFYLVGTFGNLYCYNISSADAWCDNLTNLGPPGDLNSFWRGPNHFAWLDERTLLISNYSGVIMQLNLDLLP
jgi:hypothetical protein